MTAKAATEQQVRRTARAVNGALWLVFAGVAAFSAGNVTEFALDHGTPKHVAWLVAPIVDVALFAAINADSALSRLGVAMESYWPMTLRLFAGAATWLLNVWKQLGVGPDKADPAGIVLHSVPPFMLIFLAEAAAKYRAAFLSAIEQAVAVSDAVRAEVEHAAAELADAHARAQANAEARATAEAAEAEARGEADRLRSQLDRLRTTAERSTAQRTRTAHRERTPAVSAHTAERPALSVVGGTPDERMRALWDREVAAGRVPSGAELAAAGGASPATGRRRRAEWERHLPAYLVGGAGDDAVSV